MKTMRNLSRRMTSVFLTLCFLAAMLPVPSAWAIELEAGEFNPNDGEVVVEFNLQYTQYVNVEVIVVKDDVREHFGWLMKNEWLEGYDGSLTSQNPCDMEAYTMPTPLDDSNSAGIAVQGTEAGPGVDYWLEEMPADDTHDEDYYILHWTGSIQGHPVVATNPEGDQYELIVSIQPQGDPSKPESPCVDDADGHSHGIIWTWPQYFHVETEIITFDYATILKALGIELSDLLLPREGNLSWELLMEQMSQISNWVDFSWLAQQYGFEDALQQNLECGDPVNMIDGNYFSSYPDLTLEGRYPLNFVRAYNSRGWDGGLGQGFTHSFEYKLVNDNGFVHVYLPGGEEFIFLKLRDAESQDYHTVSSKEFTLKDAGGGYRMEYKRGTGYAFNSDGQLTAITNEMGQTVYNLYYSGTELIEVEGQNGSLYLTWGGGFISSVRDSTGREVSYTNTGGNLTSVTNPDGDTLRFGYDANGYLSTSTDFEGQEYLRNTYDGKGRVTEQVFINADVETTHLFSYNDTDLFNTYISPQGYETEYHFDEYRYLTYTKDANGITLTEYNNYKASQLENVEGFTTNFNLDDNGNVTKMTYPNDNVVDISYNSRNLIRAVSYVDGSTEQFDYNGQNRLIQYTDRRGHSSSYAYDANGFLRSETNALSFTTTYNYDAKGRLLSVSDPEGGLLSYDYDAVGRVIAQRVKISDTETAETVYHYSAAGKLEKVTDALGNETEYTYTANGFTSNVKNALGDITTTEYGTNGQPLKERDAEGNETLYSYEAGSGLLESVTDPEGNKTGYTYYNDGLLAKTTDALGGETRYEYDSMDRLKTITNALGDTTVYSYDSMGRTEKIQDENGNETAYSYDKLGRMIEMTDAEGNQTAYVYDPNSNLLESKDANGISTKTEYDALNRMSKSIDGEGAETRYEYDGADRLIKRIDALGGETTYTYDYAGNMLTATDPKGNVTRYEYDKLGRSTGQKFPDGAARRTVYDAIGRVVEQYDENGGKQAMVYSANGNLLTATDPLGNETAYTYNKNGQTMTITYPDGGVTRYAYTALGQMETVTDPENNLTTYSYDPLGRTKTITDAVEDVTEYVYDSAGHVLQTTKNGKLLSETVYNKVYWTLESVDGLGNFAAYEYDAVGSLTIYTDREGNETKYEYDRNYRTVRVTDALNYTQETHFDDLGRRTWAKDQNGNETSFVYDQNGNLLEATNADGTTYYRYDARNRMVEGTDKLGAVTKLEYDPAGNLLRSTNALQAYETYVYDANSNLTRHTNRENEWVQYEYDAMNRVVKEQNQLNHSTAYEYDLVGNRVAVLDGNKNRTEYTYDGLRRTLTETNALGSKVEYSYNDLGRVESYTAEGGEGSRGTTRYDYDLAGNLLAETSPLGFVTTYTHDKEGNVLTKTDENQTVTQYSYDARYRLLQVEDEEDSALYSYDGLSNLLTAENAAGAVAFTYDALSRTTLVENEDGSETGYSYDANGNTTAIRYPDGSSVTREYDSLSRLTKLTDHDGKGIVYTRDAEGRVIKAEHPDGSTTEYDYNAAGLLTLQKEVTADHSTRREILCGYDDNGNLKSEQRSGVDIEKRDETVRYYYDAANQLVKTQIEGVTRDYSYDPAGNLLSDGAFSYRYDVQNRLVSKVDTAGNTTAYEYDAAGNLKREIGPDGAVSYVYNPQNRLVLGETEDGQSSAYVYNALGARIKNEQVRENQNAGYQNGNLLDGSNLVDYLPFLSDQREIWQRAWETEVGTTVQNDFETVTKHYIPDYRSLANRDMMVIEDGSFVQKYVYDQSGTRISAEFAYADGTTRGESGENLQSDFAVQEIGKVWYRSSHLGSSLFVVDEEGEVISHTIYDPWGKPLTETYTDVNLSGMDNANNFTGYAWDEVLGLYFAQNRFYDSQNHRFTQEDPIKDGHNWFVYCGNNPVIFVDPCGLANASLRWLAEQYGATIIWHQEHRKYGQHAEVTINGITKRFTATSTDDDRAFKDGDTMIVDDAYFYLQLNILDFSMDSMLIRMELLENLAKNYLGNTSTINEQTETVLQFIRHLNSGYRTGNWPIVAGEIDTNFITYIRNTASGLFDYFENISCWMIEVGDSIAKLDLRHFAATLNALVYNSAGNLDYFDGTSWKAWAVGEPHIDNLAGWAGDIQSLLENNIMDVYYKNGGLSYSDAYQLTKDFLQNPDPDSSRFSLPDLLSDVDAVNIYRRLDGGASLSSVMREYYSWGGIRYTEFANGWTRGAWSESAQHYTRLKFLGTVKWPLYGTLTEIPGHITEAVADAFADVLLEGVAAEQAWWGYHGV